MNKLFKVQQHYENDNGNDLVWIFDSEYKAVKFFWEKVKCYEKITNLKPKTDDYYAGFKRYMYATFQNADDTYSQYSLEEIYFEG